MLSDEQFEKLLEKIAINQLDRERLIRIETIVQMNLTNEQKCQTDMACAVASVKSSASKAHERIDEEQKARFVFTGILCSIAVIATLGGVILKLTGKL